jgi:DNA-binding NtrC family response regulator
MSRASTAAPLTQVTCHSHRSLLCGREVLLRVTAGHDRGKVALLGDRPVHVGASTDNDLVLADGEVSRRHLRVARAEQGYLVEDLGSTNGTYYRGALVQQAMVGAGAEIRAGKSVIRLEVGQDRSTRSGQGAFGGLVGSSPAMQEVFGVLAAVAPTDMTVLIEGETGTGKELVARELHRQSNRRDGPLVVVDCASLPEGLVESELFGHERGAFSGADRSRDGSIASADGGTLFFDEIGELPLELQTRLLRLIDRREVRRVGGERWRAVDLRVVAATNRDLRQESRAGRFRRDLYFRLAVARVPLPPLRQRKEDIPELVRHFLRTFGHDDPDTVLGEEVIRSLVRRAWPGNVRQLRNFIERVVLMVDGGQAPTDIPAGSTPGAARTAPTSTDWLERVLPRSFLGLPYKVAKEALIRNFDRLYLQRLLDLHGRNIHCISREARVDRVLVRRMLRKLDDELE